MLLLFIAAIVPLLAVITALAVRRRREGPRLLCPACGGAVERDFNACPACGTRLRLSCPACGESVRALWRACPHCGTHLEEDHR